jgi:AraC family transcriptional regulator, regulatory protein of adaptative response / methylated-DNA-[protein]-cysteine methyltransferase
MDDYQRIEQAIHWIESHHGQQPSVADMATELGLSQSRFQHLFQRWAGISPKRFAAVLTAAHARQLLQRSTPLLETTLACGLSSPGRLHELFVQHEAVTPGDIQRGGAGLDIHYGIHASPFGPCLVAETRRGVCALDFVVPGHESQATRALAERWPGARLMHDPQRSLATLNRILAGLRTDAERPRIGIRGTNFQVRVWSALLCIRPGQLASYQQVATAIGQPGATRAVGTAIGANPVPLLIPCHRVIRASGAFGHYSGGRLRKRAILAWEQATTPPEGLYSET